MLAQATAHDWKSFFLGHTPTTNRLPRSRTGSGQGQANQCLNQIASATSRPGPAPAPNVSNERTNGIAIEVLIRSLGPQSTDWFTAAPKMADCVPAAANTGLFRYDEPVSRVIFIKGEQFGVAALPLAGFKIPPQILQSCFGVADGPEGRTAGSDV